MEEWTGRINADYNSREDPVQNGGLGLTFEEQLGSQNTVMKRKCIPSVRNSTNNCKRCYPWEMAIWVMERVWALELDQPAFKFWLTFFQ